MRARDRLIGLILLVLAVSVASGCVTDREFRTPTPVVKKAADPVTTADGLRQWWVPDASGVMFVRPPRLQAERYRAYLLEPPLLHFRQLSAKPSRGEAIRLSRNLADVIRRRIEASFGWTEATEPGPEVVRIRVQASNIDFASPDSSSHSRTTALVSAGGLVYFMFEMQDSETRNPLLRFGVRRRLPGGTFNGPSWHELDRARQVFRAFGFDIGPNLESVAQN